MAEGMQQELALRCVVVKYASKWLRKVFPNGTLADKERERNGEGRPSPVHWIVYHHDSSDDAYSQRDGQHLPVLKPGVLVFESQETTVAEPFHPALPRDMPYLMGRNQDWSNNMPDYLSIVFSKPCVAYVLITTMNQEPKWLRDDFYKLRDPNFAEVTVKVNWNLHMSGKAIYVMMGKYAEWKRSTFRVFRSKRVYRPGDKLVLGGPGLAYMTDMLYLVAFQNATTTQMREARPLKTPLKSKVQDSVCQTISFVTGNSGVNTPPYNVGDSPSGLIGTRPVSAPHLDGSTHQDSGGDAGVGMGRLLPKSGADDGPDAAEVIPRWEEGSCMFTYQDAWMPKLIKSIRRGRLADVRQMVNADLELPPEVSYLRTHDITLLPPGDYKEVLTVDVAVKNGQLEMLCILVSKCRCGLSYSALRFLVHHWEQVPVAFRSAEQILMDYVLMQPAPLAVVTATVRALRVEIRQRYKKKPTADLEEALQKMQSFQLLLLDEVRESLRHTGGDDLQEIPRLRQVLDPPAPHAGPLLISELPPLRIALEDQDAEFVDAPLVQSYMNKLWLGHEFVLETCKDGSNGMTLLDPSFSFNTMVNTGFASPDMHTLHATARLVHYILWGQQAFFNSPKARWAMDFLGKMIFLIAFLQIVGVNLLPSWNPYSGDVSDEEMEAWVDMQIINTVIFCTFTFGNIMEAMVVLLFRYRSNALRYLSRHPATGVYLLVDMLLLYLTILYALKLKGHPAADYLSEEQFLRCQMVWAAMAPLLMGRVIAVIIPIVSSLGPMLNTMGAMFTELMIFMLPWSFITVGFAIALQVIYRQYAEDIESLAPFASFWQTAFLLLQAFTDKFDYTIFDALPIQDLRIFGKAIFMLYAICNGLLLANLLIAIITNRYKPDQVKLQASLNMAEVIDYYAYQVEKSWLSSPWCLLQMAFFWLPAGTRPKVHMFEFYKRSLPFLDGFTAASSRYYPTLPTGRNELPHLLYLCTLHVLVCGIWLAAFVIHAPFCIIYFTLHGHKQALKECKAMMGHLGSSKHFDFGDGSTSMAPSGTMRSRRASESFVTGSSEFEFIAATTSAPTANLASFKTWWEGTKTVCFGVGYLILGIFEFTFMWLVGQTLWVFSGWICSIIFSVINVGRGVFAPLMRLLAPPQPELDPHAGTNFESVPSAGGLVSASVSGPGSILPPRLSILGGRGNKVAPANSLSSVTNKSSNKAIMEGLRQLLQQARDKIKQNPAYMQPDVLQRLITHVWGDRVRLLKKNVTESSEPPHGKLARSLSSRPALNPSIATAKSVRIARHDNGQQGSTTGESDSGGPGQVTGEAEHAGVPVQGRSRLSMASVNPFAASGTGHAVVLGTGDAAGDTDWPRGTRGGCVEGEVVGQDMQTKLLNDISSRMTSLEDAMMLISQRLDMLVPVQQRSAEAPLQAVDL